MKKNKLNLYFFLSLLALLSFACSVISGAVPAATPTVEPAPATSEGQPPTASLPTPAPATDTAEAPAPVDTETAQATATGAPPPPPAGVYGPAFARYPLSPAVLPDRYEGNYSLPLTLENVKGFDPATLSQDQQALLEQNGFVVAAPEAGKYREFYQIYESQRYASDQPIFATADAAFHVYHLIFDKMLRDLEKDHFIPGLESLTRAMLPATQAQYDAVRGTALEEPARRNVAFFGVAAQLLGLPDPIPAEAQDLVSAEMALIEAHGGVNISPIWDRPDLADDNKLREDYSQYIPRGHYTRSEALERYFKAMMWYGRLTFRLRDAFETRRALLLVQALRTAQTEDGSPALNQWQNIFEPITFIVGKADDLSYFEYSALSDQAFGPGAAPQAFADDAKLAQFTEAARQLPPPQVNSMWVWIWEDKQEATQGFRFMGQRFTLDQYVFGQLIWRNVGTQSEPRGLPKALDFMAALGSEEAQNLLNDMGENQYANYTQQMDKVRQEVSTLGEDSWTQNLYWAWLYMLKATIEPKDERYPAFMQTQAWTRKDLQTALGSWTELKHDTILYAKQVMAEMGGGGVEEPPHGWVEPNPVAYARALALVKMTYNGLSERNLLSDTTRANLENLDDLLSFMKRVSEAELAGTTLSNDDYWRIQYFGGELEALTIASADCPDTGEAGMCRDLSDQKAALVADVATGITKDQQLVVLEEGVGQPTPIFVILPDSPVRIAIGAVFTYYEFTVSPDQRMTDETWQGQVESGTNPPQPDWTEMFIAK